MGRSTMFFWEVVLVTAAATAAAASSFAAAATAASPATVAALVTSEHFPSQDLEAAGLQINNEVSKEENLTEYWNSIEERVKRRTCEYADGECMSKKTAKRNCSGKLNKKAKCGKKRDVCCVNNDKYQKCENAGGECILKKKLTKKCNGKVDKTFMCKNKKYVCCISAPTTPAPTTPPPTTPPPTTPPPTAPPTTPPPTTPAPTTLPPTTPPPTTPAPTTLPPTTPPPTTSITVCPSGSVLVGGQCLVFRQEMLTWNGSKKACDANNLNLASLTDPDATLAYILATYGNTRFWVGGTDAATEGLWKWLDGTAIPLNNTQFPWADRKPDSWRGNQDCLSVNYKGGFDDGTCSVELGYICEAPKTLTPATPAPTTPAPTTAAPITSAPTTPITVCPSGSVLVGGQCLVFRQETLNWDASKKACDANNLNLASLTDPDATLAYVQATYGSLKFWVGGTDVATEGVWKWLDGTAIPLNRTQFPWAAGQPDSWGNQDCLTVNFKGGFDDSACSNKRGYICEVIWE